MKKRKNSWCTYLKIRYYCSFSRRSKCRTYLEFDGIKHVLRTIPSGIFHKTAVNIGNGVIDPVVFNKEIEGLEKFNLDIKSKLIISRKAHLILPTHRLLDAASEASKGKAKIGSTLKGIDQLTWIKRVEMEFVWWYRTRRFQREIQSTADKHEAMISFYDVNIQYNLDELRKNFWIYRRIKKLDFIDSEEYLHQAQKSG
jgi:adenylosuccinate synthase